MAIPMLSGKANTQWLSLLMMSTVAVSASDSKLAGGGQFNCMKVLGEAVCWGENLSGQLGLGYTSTVELPTVIPLGTGFTVKDLGCGYSHCCALNDAGKVKCWGKGNNGQTGYNHDTDIGASADQMGDFLDFVNLPFDAIQIGT